MKRPDTPLLVAVETLILIYLTDIQPVLTDNYSFSFNYYYYY